MLTPIVKKMSRLSAVALRKIIHPSGSTYRHLTRNLVGRLRKRCYVRISQVGLLPFPSYEIESDKSYNQALSIGLINENTDETAAKSFFLVMRVPCILCEKIRNSSEKDQEEWRSYCYTISNCTIFESQTIISLPSINSIMTIARTLSSIFLWGISVWSCISNDVHGSPTFFVMSPTPKCHSVEVPKETTVKIHYVAPGMLCFV